MNKLTKFLTAFVLLAVLALSGAIQTKAESNTLNFKIFQVDVDGITIQESGPSVYVERDSTAVIEVWLEGLSDTNSRTKIKAWVGGFEHGDIEDTTNIFEVEAGVLYRKVLKLEIPEDIDASQDYTLHIEAFDDQDSDDRKYTLRIQEKRHLLKIQDVIFNPSDLEVEAGKTVFAIVRVENLGDRKEEDVKVTLSIPALGLSTRTFIEELVTSEQCDVNDDCDEDEETSQSSDELFLRIPKDTKSGKYDILVNVEYDRGHEETEKKYVLNVVSGEPGITPVDRITINVDSPIKEVAQGKGVVYKVLFANLGTEAKQFSLGVSGLESWSTYRVDPSTVTVQPGQTQEMFIFVSANQNAALGNRIFTVDVRSGSDVVKQFNLQSNVVQAAQAGTDVESLKKGLELGFVVLLIILVILGLILAISRLRKGERRAEEPGTAEGQTYYNYPRY